MIHHRLVEVAEGVSHVLHLAVVSLTLRLPQMKIQNWASRSREQVLVAEELFLDGKPDLPSDVASLVNDVLEVDGNGAEQP
jgi:hypothetical protein